MGWFKDTVEERLNALERKVLVLSLDKERRDAPRSGPVDIDGLPSEGEYIGEVVRLEPPRIVSLGYRIPFIVRVPGQPNFAHIAYITDTKGVAEAVWAAREAYVGKKVKVKAKHRAIPSGSKYDGCTTNATRIVVAWSITEWLEGSTNEAC